MIFSNPLALALAAIPFISALPLPNPGWDSPKAVAAVKSCALGMTLIGGACVAAATLPSHPAVQIGGAAVGLAATATGGHAIAKELKDSNTKNTKELNDAADANHKKVVAEQEERQKTAAAAAAGPPGNGPKIPTPKTSVKELQKQSHKLKGWA